MTIVFYISGHGFGHASRDVELINAIAARRPDVQFQVRTSVPDWLFTRSRAAVDVRRLEADVGLVQIDSLHFDERQTALDAAAFYGTFDERAEQEARALQANHADLVIGDIPPLAFAAADRADLPSIAVGNFTWDWIYAEYPLFETLAADVIPTIQEAYATASRALRLPFHGGFVPMEPVTIDVPLIARRSRRDPGDTRRLLGIDASRPLVLASFGGYGAAVPYEAASADGAFTLLTIDRDPPHGLAYEDVVAAADVVLSKPGYGIVSECIANETALLYTSRGRFVEYDVFVAQMPRMLRCREIPQADLFTAQWTGHISALLAQPDPPHRPRVDGAEVAAAEILHAAGD
jgi:L-arabinokinase